MGRRIGLFTLIIMLSILNGCEKSGNTTKIIAPDYTVHIDSFVGKYAGTYYNISLIDHNSGYWDTIFKDTIHSDTFTIVRITTDSFRYHFGYDSLDFLYNDPNVYYRVNSSSSGSGSSYDSTIITILPGKDSMLYHYYGSTGYPGSTGTQASIATFSGIKIQ